MPCFSTKYRNYIESKTVDGRIKTANDRDINSSVIVSTPIGSRSKSAKPNDLSGQLKEKCRRMGKMNLARLRDPILPHSEVLSVVGFNTTNCNKNSQRKRVTLYHTILPKRELARLQEASKVTSLEEHVENLAKIENESRRLHEECEERKRTLKEIDDARNKLRQESEKEKGITSDGDYAEEKMKTLEKAFLAKHEQEEEVKKANRVILNAKCDVVRHAQIQEKHEMARQMKLNETRLDKIMLDESLEHIRKEDEKTIKSREVRLKYADDIKKQLQEREMLRTLEAKRIDAEIKMRAQAIEAMKRDNERRDKEAAERRLKLKNDLAMVCEMSKLFKQMMFEQEKEAELRIQAYMDAKEKREKKLEVEKKLAKEAFERKQLQLYTLQKRILESKSEQVEMSLTREQEVIDREYRRKEKEAALRKKKLEAEIREGREAQLNAIKQRQSLLIAKSEEDFAKIVETLKKAEEEERINHQERLINREKYRLDIIRQMNEKELNRRQMEAKAKNEFLAWREREDERNANIRAVIQAKIQAMHEANLPEKYIREVEMKLKNITKNTQPPINNTSGSTNQP